MRESQVDEMKREFQSMARAPEGLEDDLMAGRLPASPMTPLESPAEAQAEPTVTAAAADENEPVTPPPP
jgi:hypothetical protein